MRASRHFATASRFTVAPPLTFTRFCLMKISISRRGRGRRPAAARHCRRRAGGPASGRTSPCRRASGASLRHANVTGRDERVGLAPARRVERLERSEFDQQLTLFDLHLAREEQPAPSFRLDGLEFVGADRERLVTLDRNIDTLCSVSPAAGVALAAALSARSPLPSRNRRCTRGAGLRCDGFPASATRAVTHPTLREPSSAVASRRLVLLDPRTRREAQAPIAYVVLETATREDAALLDDLDRGIREGHAAGAVVTQRRSYEASSVGEQPAHVASRDEIVGFEIELAALTSEFRATASRLRPPIGRARSRDPPGWRLRRSHPNGLDANLGDVLARGDEGHPGQTHRRTCCPYMASSGDENG